jgi:GrpB-like predicted nucleotidyltransferase (UPF0157 family)
MTPIRILPYASQPRNPEVAALLIRAIQDQDPRLRVDHVGSTSVPGCHGKGVIDLAVTYLDGDLEAAKSALAALGFQPQTGRDPWPETRPMRVGAVSALGSTFQIHAHVILRGGDEHRELLGFRNALRHDPSLRAAYEAAKERIISSGITDSLDYCYAKGEFVIEALSAIAKSLRS